MIIDLDDDLQAAPLPSSRDDSSQHPDGDAIPQACGENGCRQHRPSQQQQHHGPAAAGCNVQPSTADVDRGPPGSPDADVDRDGHKEHTDCLADGDVEAAGKLAVEAVGAPANDLSDSSKMMKTAQLGPPLPNGVSRQQADSLIAMGFSQAQASRALLATQGNLPRAINWILQS